MPISTKVTYSVKKDERHRQIICALCPPHLPQLWYEADGQDDSTNSAQHVLYYAGNHGCGGFSKLLRTRFESRSKGNGGGRITQLKVFLHVSADGSDRLECHRKAS